MKKLLLLLIFPLFIGSTTKYEYKYEIPFAPIIYSGINDSIPTIDQFGRIRNGIIVENIAAVLNTDPSGVKLTRAELDYIRSIVGGLYVIGVWQKCVAIYGFVGGNEWKHKWNWKDMRDLDAAFRLVFFGGVSHNSSGIKSNGTTGHANTFLTPSTTLTIGNTHLSVYINSNDAVSNVSSSLRVSTSGSDLGIITKRQNGNINSIQPTNNTVFTNFNVTPSPFSAIGYYIGQNNSTEHSFYYNGFKLTPTTTQQQNFALPNLPLFLMAQSNNGAAQGFDVKTIPFASIGSSLTDQQAISSSQVITYSQGILNRK